MLFDLVKINKKVLLTKLNVHRAIAIRASHLLCRGDTNPFWHSRGLFDLHKEFFGAQDVFKHLPNRQWNIMKELPPPRDLIKSVVGRSQQTQL